MNITLMEDTSVNFYPPRLQTGQIVLYEGEEVEVISLTPLFIVKGESRVVCGALHTRIEFIRK
jgi:hypothetical protein